MEDMIKDIWATEGSQAHCTGARANRRTLTFNPHDISFEKPAGFFKTNHPMLGSQW